MSPRRASLALALALAVGPAVAAAQPVAVASDVPRVPAMPATCTPYVFGGHAYYFCRADGGLPAAQTFCRSFGTEVASLASRFENDLVAGVVQSLGRGRHWIGYTDAAQEGTFVALDGSPTSFSGWAFGEPNNVGDEDCVELDGGGIWNDVACQSPLANVVCEETSPCTAEVWGDHLYRFCRRPATWSEARAWCGEHGGGVAVVESEAERAFVVEHARALAGEALVGVAGNPRAPALLVGGQARGVASPGTRAGAFVCEDAAPCVRRFHDRRTYLFCTRPAITARDAALVCRSHGGALATIDSAAEDAFVYAGLGLFRRSRFFIGLTDEGSEGVFHSFDGRPSLYARWLPGEPNNDRGSEHCVELNDHGWNDVPCDFPGIGAFVCETP